MIVGLAAALGGCVSPMLESGGEASSGLIALGNMAKHTEPPPAPAPVKSPFGAFDCSDITILPRSSWTRSAPITTRLNPMRGIGRLTVHHSGDVFNASSRDASAGELERIRVQHLKRMSAGDIGYHFIIDRAGRVWQGRHAIFQGAHVKHNNPHNLGICVLGNFEKQIPSIQQKRRLRVLLGSLMKTLHIPVGRIHTHREFAGATLCPGKHLQSHLNALRRA
jgi:hypothetical protein